MKKRDEPVRRRKKMMELQRKKGRVRRRGVSYKKRKHMKTKKGGDEEANRNELVREDEGTERGTRRRRKSGMN